MSTRKWFSELAPAAFLIGACFVVPGAGVAISLVTGLAATVAAEPTDQALGWVKRRLSGESKDAINHDLENAMKRGYVRAINFLEDIWVKSYQRDSGSTSESDPAELFRWLREDADDILSAPRLRAFLDDAESMQTFGHSQQLDAFLEPYLYGRTDEIGTFLKRSLVSNVALFFGEELKSDTRAWRAFQRVVTDSMLAGVQRLEVGQARQHSETSARLEELLKRFDEAPPEHRLDDGLGGLEQTIANLRDEVKSAIEADGRLTREVIDLSFDLLTLQADEHHVVVVGRLASIHESIEQLVSRQEIETIPESRDKIVDFGGRIPNQYFVGRDGLQTWIEESFEATSLGGGTAVVLHGLGGVGKTQLALEYASRHEAEYAGVWWLLADSEASLVQGYAKLAERLDLPASRSGELHVAAETARRYLEFREDDDRWLLVFDNVNDVELADRWLPARGAVDALITSRLSVWDSDRTYLTKWVDVLSQDEARELLLLRTGDHDVQAANAIAAELGRLPLALEQAGAFIMARREVRSLAMYLELFRKDPRQFLTKHRPKTGGYPETVGTTWAISLAAATVESPAAPDLMVLLSFLAPDAIPLDLIIAAAGELPDRLRDALIDPELRGIEVLARYSLISLGSTGDLAIHRLVQLVTRAELDPEFLDRVIGLSLSLMVKLSSLDMSSFENWGSAARLAPHVAMTLKLSDSLEPLDLTRSTLASRLASYLFSQGELTGARAMYEETLALRRRVLPREHPAIAISLNSLARVLEAQGDLTGARAMYEEALALRRRVLPAEHPDIAGSLNNLAHLMQKQGELTGARKMHEEALVLMRRALPFEHPDIATILNNLALVMEAQGDLAEALVKHQEALALRRRVLPPEHPDIAGSLNNLAGVMQRQEELSEARAMFEEALSLRRRVLPAEHPDIATSLNNLASVLSAQGDLSGARAMYEGALSLMRRVLPAEHPDIATSLNNLASVLGAQGDLSGARAMYEEALPLMRRMLPAEHSDIATILLNLADMMAKQEEFSGARVKYEEGLIMLERVLPVEHPDIATARAKLDDVNRFIDDQKSVSGVSEI